MFQRKGEMEGILWLTKINHIRKLTNDFIVYSCIYSTGLPNSFQKLLNYILKNPMKGGGGRGAHDVTKMEKKYDKQLRLR